MTGPTATETRTASLCDVRARVPDGILIVACVCGLAGVASISLGTRPGVPDPVGMIIMVVAMFAGIGLVQAWAAARFRRDLLRGDPSDGVNSSALITDILQRHTKFALNTFDRRRSPLRDLAVTLARRDPGRAYRVSAHPQELPPAPQPLAFTFEPVPLARGSDAFNELSGEQPPQAEPVREMMSFMLRSARHTWFGKAGMIVMLVLAGLGLLYHLTRALFTAIRGDVPDLFAPLTIIAAFVILPIAWKALRPESWILVPGGMLVRQSAWNQVRWRLNLFHSDQSVLLYWFDQNLLVVADATGRKFSRTIARREAEMAFRAWQSPAPPPALERLSDLV